MFQGGPYGCVGELRAGRIRIEAVRPATPIGADRFGFPMNFLIIESLQKFHHYYGNDFKVECPTGSGRYLTIDGVATELSQRLSRLFLKDARGDRGRAASSAGVANGPRTNQDCIPLLRVFSRRYRPRASGASHPVGVDIADRQTAHARGAAWIAIALKYVHTGSIEDPPMNDTPESPIKRSEDEWKKELPPRDLLRHAQARHGTRPARAPLNKEHRAGSYACAALRPARCSNHPTKFDSGTGLAEFSFRATPQGRGHDPRIALSAWRRTEVHCGAAGGGHLGTCLFPDGPQAPPGERYCMNGVALRFEAESSRGVRPIPTRMGDPGFDHGRNRPRISFSGSGRAFAVKAATSNWRGGGPRSRTEPCQSYRVWLRQINCVRGMDDMALRPWRRQIEPALGPPAKGKCKAFSSYAPPSTSRPRPWCSPHAFSGSIAVYS